MKTKQLLRPGLLVTVRVPYENMASRIGIIKHIHDDKAHVFIYTVGAGGFGVSHWMDRKLISL